MKSPVQMATYPATAHRAVHTACPTAPPHCRGRRDAAIVPTAAAPQPKATCRAKGALARLAARRTSRIHSRSINEPPRPGPATHLPRHPATSGLTALAILKREPASRGRNAEPVWAHLKFFRSLAGELPGNARLPSPRALCDV